MNPLELACAAGLYMMTQLMAYLAVLLVTLARAVTIATLAIRSFYARPLW